jgi:hypothetical protein
MDEILMKNKWFSFFTHGTKLESLPVVAAPPPVYASPLDFCSLKKSFLLQNYSSRCISL